MLKLQKIKKLIPLLIGLIGLIKLHIYIFHYVLKNNYCIITLLKFLILFSTDSVFKNPCLNIKRRKNNLFYIDRTVLATVKIRNSIKTFQYRKHKKKKLRNHDH